MTDEDVKALRESHLTLLNTLEHCAARMKQHNKQHSEQFGTLVFGHSLILAGLAVDRARALQERIENGQP